MKNETSKSLTIGAIAVVLLMAWQMRSHPAGNVQLPEDHEPLQKLQRSPSSKTSQKASAEKKYENKKALIQAIHAMKDCSASEKCDLPQTDAKSYEIAVGQNLKNLLADFRSQYGADPKNFGDMQSLALEFIKSPDEYVQEEALKMFSALPTSMENLEAITQAMGDTTDPLLVDQTMSEMKRYIGTSEEGRVHEYLRHLLGEGAVFSSEAAAKKILSFINTQSYLGYESVARTLPTASTVGQNLRTALEEYRRLQTGG